MSPKVRDGPSGKRTAGLAVAVIAAVLIASCRVQLTFDDQSCAHDGDCGLPSLHCAAGACVACVSDQHCTTAGLPRCDATNHVCVQCQLPGDCPVGDICRNNRCLPPCVSGTPCPAASPICDDGVCWPCDDGQGCKTSTTGQTCLEHVCVECATDAQCSGMNPFCQAVTHRCVQCRQNVDCASATPLCDLGPGRCAAAP